MESKNLNAAMEMLAQEKFKFTLTKEQIKNRILQNKKVDSIEENFIRINDRGELEEKLEIQLKIGDFISQSQQIELTLTHTGNDAESDVYSIFGSIDFEFEDLYFGESKEITRLGDYHTASGRPDGILEWLDSQIDSMTSKEVCEDGEYLRYLFN